MQDNYSQFLNTYITESFELLSNMEELLLEINEDDPSKDDLNAIFRCAHSIKGGAGAFNLARVTSFTHVLETLLDLYRDDKLKVTKDAIGVLLKSVDILNGLITSAKNNETVSSDVGIEVENKLKSFYENQGKNSSNNNVTPNNQPTINKVVESVKSDVNKQYLIKFLPNFDLF